MKKTILVLIVLLTAALVFTGCKKDAEIPPLEGTWIGSVNVPEETGGGNNNSSIHKGIHEN